jgi:hypothetical protein
MARFTRLAAQQGLELGQNEMATCSTRPGNARACPDARPRACRANPTPATIKPTSALTVHPRSLPTPPERQFTGDHFVHGVPAAARAPATLDWPLQPSSTPTNPSASLPKTPWSSPSPWTELHIVGGAGLTSSDFARSLAHEDRATRWATGRFLALRTPLTTSEAPRAVWLSSTSVSRPEHALPTSPTACTRPAHLQPSPSAIRPSTWPPEAPGPHPALHRTSSTAGKPRHHFSSLRLLFRRGVSSG